MVDAIVELIKSLVGFETLIQWAGSKLVENYGVNSLEVKRVRDAVVLVIKADGDDKLDKVESDLRSAISKMGFTKKIDVEVVSDGQ